ncbi:D-alanyl-D-alanine carboxypeptidase/D-alanyl-D-alanine-endopeptidase [Brucella intermedia]|uniref:D-alanyl-D-alanine carboxypeptidase/D-alanyl-D-alanine endopeptidase n=1 Tax=Brucella intermedia TaxID=94625 RepID=UPI0023612E33|nr:D-alanyl-D-alanine carboxypeptidase/D-alanyl-D-alanine-endopeptidase [Brucella intermedia]
MVKSCNGLLPLFILLFAGCTTPYPFHPSKPNLRVEIAKIRDKEIEAGSEMGIIINDAQTGEVLYQAHADRRFTPASNTKLLTSAAAFGVLGPNYRFETRLFAGGRTEGDTLVGDVYLQGSGDPTLHPQNLEAFAAALAKRGIKEIQGHLILDDSSFDKIPLGAGWSWDDEKMALSAQVSALNYSFTPEGDINVVRVDVRPGESKYAAGRAVYYPSNDIVKLMNLTTTGDETALKFERKPGSNLIIVTGTIGLGEQGRSELVTIDSPTQVVGGILKSAFRTHGIKLQGRIIEGKVPPGVQLVSTQMSKPLSDLAVTLLKYSNNGYAEILTKAMGQKTRKRGDWPSGLLAIREYIRGLGIDTDRLRQVDGSGLSRMNQLTPRQLAALLRRVTTEPWFNAWYKALPVAGEPGIIGGTLKNRMLNSSAAGRTHAKTGTMTGVSALSGYIDPASGRRMIFSIISNNYLVSTAKIKAVEDELVELLANCGSTVACR